MHAMCVCNYISSEQSKHKKYTFGACPLEVLRGPLIFHQFLSYPYNKPHMWFVHEISQSKDGNPYNLPLWLFRDKTTTHINPHNKNRNYKDFLHYKEISINYDL